MMSKKQKVIPETSILDFKDMSNKQLRDWCKNHYENYIGSTVKNDNIGIVIEFKRRGRKKTSHGSYMSKKKASVVKILKDVLQCAVYSNWGDRKATDPEDVIGYLNFKCKVRVDGCAPSIICSLICRVKSV